jgi:hypothetical protein
MFCRRDDQTNNSAVPHQAPAILVGILRNFWLRRADEKHLSRFGVVEEGANAGNKGDGSFMSIS